MWRERAILAIAWAETNSDDSEINGDFPRLRMADELVDWLAKVAKAAGEEGIKAGELREESVHVLIDLGREAGSRASLTKVLMSLEELEAYRTQAFFSSLEDIRAIAAKEETPMNLLNEVLRSANDCLPEFTDRHTRFQDYLGLFETLVSKVSDSEDSLKRFTESDFVELVWPVMKHAMEVNSGKEGHFATFHQMNPGQSLWELSSKLPSSMRAQLKAKLNAWVTEDETRRRPFASVLNK